MTWLDRQDCTDMFTAIAIAVLIGGGTFLVVLVYVLYKLSQLLS